MYLHVPAQVSQTYLSGNTMYYLSSGRGVLCQAAEQRGHDIVSLEV